MHKIQILPEQTTIEADVGCYIPRIVIIVYQHAGSLWNYSVKFPINRFSICTLYNKWIKYFALNILIIVKSVEDEKYVGKCLYLVMYITIIVININIFYHQLFSFALAFPCALHMIQPSDFRLADRRYLIFYKLIRNVSNGKEEVYKS